MESGNKTISTILAILFVCGMGVGGYYLGWFLDKQAANKQALVNEKSPKTFNDTTYGIKFTYPGNWKLEKSEDAKNISVVSPDGSRLSYVLDTTLSLIETCATDDNSLTKGSTKKCTYISGTNYGRFEDSTKSVSELGTFWGIVEKADDANPNAYSYNSGDSFMYFVKNNSDLTALDNIMKSVVRSK